jgi:hypothetical protein
VFIITYKHIKSKLRNMALKGEDDKRKTFLGGRGRKAFFFGHQLKMV